MRFCWIMLLGIAGCSPNNYAPEVTAFSSGVDQVARGFTAGYAALATDRAAEVQIALADARARVAKTAICEAAVNQAVPGTDAPCLLYRLNGPPPQTLAAETGLKKTKTLMAALQDYAQALAAVTNAADRAAYDAAVARLAGSLSGLAGGAGPSGAAAGAGVSAGVNLLGWVVGSQLDEQRFETLKAAVNAVGTSRTDAPTTIKTATDGLGKGLRGVRDARLATLNAELDLDTDRLGPGLADTAYRQRLSDAEALATSIEALRETDPVATAAALNAAHEALVQAVNDPSRGVSSLVDALAQFSDRAQALQAAFAAGTPPKTVPVRKGT